MIPAFEMKFLISEDQARAIEARVCELLTVDSHREPALGNAYRVTSLYCDTPSLDTYWREPPLKRS